MIYYLFSLNDLNIKNESKGCSTNCDVSPEDWKSREYILQLMI